MKYALRVLVRTAILLVVLFLAFLLWATLTDFRPDEVTAADGASTGPEVVLPDSFEFSVLIWNIGYCGLDSSMDFFYDGGEQVRPPQAGAEQNLEGIRHELGRNAGDLDFILLQEVDRDSKRSYHVDQAAAFISDLSPRSWGFAANYKAGFVPLPPRDPMGKVYSGLLSLSSYRPDSMARHDFPGSYSWPTRLFMLDRCFLVQRFRVSKGKQLLIVNTHNSAYDDGSLKAAEMSCLRDFLLREYEDGNYVIVGGDWNQCPPGFVPAYSDQPLDTVDLKYIAADFLPQGWSWAYDPSAPSNRRVRTAYDPGITPTTVIDYFLVSPNVRVISPARCLNLNFVFSDHNPVFCRFRLMPE